MRCAVTPIELSALAIALLVSSPSEAKTKPNVITISNICIRIERGYDYTVVSNIDYYRVNVSRNGSEGYIYIGHNPEILDVNRKWQSHVLRSKMKASKVVYLEGSQAGQTLGIPMNEDGQYFHLWFKTANLKANDSIRELVGFC
jgi:hypothetical protein